MTHRIKQMLPRRMRAVMGRVGRGVLAKIMTPLQPAVPPGAVEVLCHCHYPDLVPELATRLLALPRGATLHVSSDAPQVFATWARYRPRSRAPILFHPTENRGRDLRPFFEVARGLALGPDTVVLKIHGKRSLYSAQGEWWRRDTLRELFPGPFAARRALDRFHRDPRLALLGAPGSFIAHPVYWGRNRGRVAALMRDITSREVADDDLGFLAGSMFWIRGAFLTALLPHMDPDLFEPEPLEQDGSHAHALERVIGMAALAWGWHIGEVGTAEPLTRDEVRHRKIAYL